MSEHPLLGWSTGDPQSRVPLSYPRDGNMMTVAGTGTGKTRKVAFPNYIRNKASMFGLDFKGTAASNFSHWRSAILGQEVRVFDPLRLVDPKLIPNVNGKPVYATADPIDFIKAAKSPHAAASKISEVSIPPDSLTDSHWADGAQGLFTSTELFVAIDPLFDNLGLQRNMKSVWLLLSDPELERNARRLMALSEIPGVADQASAFLKAGKDNREMQGIRNQIRVACSKTFNEPAILESLTGTNVDFSQMTKRPMTVFVVLPGDMAVTHNKYLRILTTMALSSIESSGLRAHDDWRPPCIFELDEFATLGKNFRIITEGMGRLREYGIRFHLYLQNLSQAKELYGDGYNTIMGNIGLLQYFGGTSDLFTAEEISKRSGVETRVQKSINDNSSPSNPGGTSWSTYGRPVFMPDEVARLRMPFQLLLPIGQKPIVGQLFHPGLDDFWDWKAFQSSIEEGHTVDWATQVVRHCHEKMAAEKRAKRGAR